MGINIEWINERNEALVEISDPGFLLSRLVTNRWLSSTNSVCLRFIEPWGDTVFNQTQAPFLLDELKSELSTNLDPATEDHLHNIISLVTRAIGQTGTYIKFVGD